MERALITGAAGFIGSHLAAELLRRGWSVTGLDARSPASDPVAAENLAELPAIPASSSWRATSRAGTWRWCARASGQCSTWRACRACEGRGATGSATTWPATSWVPSGCWRRAPRPTCPGWCSPRHPASTGQAPGSPRKKVTCRCRCRPTGCRSWRPSGCAWHTGTSGARPPAWSRCGTSPCTVPGSARTWHSAGSCGPRCQAGRCHCTGRCPAPRLHFRLRRSRRRDRRRAGRGRQRGVRAECAAVGGP
jgi:hypothetical protein